MTEPLIQGKSLRLTDLGDGLVELCFDREGEAINKLCQRTMAEWREAVGQLSRAAADGRLRGVLVSSAKEVFIVGADITGFGDRFARSAAQIEADAMASHALANAFEDLPVPTVAALPGYALGGGLEIALTANARVMSTAAMVGVPEVKLGLLPGLAGTVRLTRLAGPEVAADWVSGGKPRKAPEALGAGVVNAVCAPEALRETALQWLRDAIAGRVDWRALQARKREPLALAPEAVKAAFDAALARIRQTSPPHQPAADIAVSAMAAGALLPREQADALEAQAFGRVFKTQAARSLVQAFLNDQALKKRARAAAKGAAPVQQLAVLGAGIMGGGIAVTAALRGTPTVRLKDIHPAALDAGMQQAGKLVARQVQQGRLSADKAAAAQRALVPQADDTGMAEVDLVIEAVVEKLSVKHQVLGALAQQLKPDAVIASNTSSLRIADIARPLPRPQQVVGMHFFNPVPQMPLVEVVRTPASSDAAVATAVAMGQAMGKTAIVVQDVPGFLVNRCLLPYVNAWLQLVADGADFEAVDPVMQAFGWPMGPAYLQDVIGMDTGVAVFAVIAAGYPDRMAPVARDAIAAMVAAGRLGQKNGKGFYRYTPDAGGKPQRSSCTEARALVAALQTGGPRAFSDAQVIDRLMLPMVLEAARALEEGVVATAAEVDTALQLGVGFPAYLGGPLQYADGCGLADIVARCDALAGCGPAYVPSERLREMARSGATFHVM